MTIKMIFNDLKLTIMNAIVLILSFIKFTFIDFENVLKAFLLVVTIVYTLYKTYEIHNNIKDKKKNGSNNS